MSRVIQLLHFTFIILHFTTAIRLTLPNSSCRAHSSDEGFCEMS